MTVYDAGTLRTSLPYYLFSNDAHQTQKVLYGSKIWQQRRDVIVRTF